MELTENQKEKMKTFKLIILLLIAGIFFNSCKKYEDGPAISLKTKKMRLCRKWLLTEGTLDGNTLRFSDYMYTDEYEYKTNGKYIIIGEDARKAKPSYLEGTWSFSDKKENLVHSIYTNNSETLNILRLTSKDLWLSQETGLGRLTYKYKAK
jgi:hypothetical protein